MYLCVFFAAVGCDLSDKCHVDRWVGRSLEPLTNLTIVPGWFVFSFPIFLRFSSLSDSYWSLARRVIKIIVGHADV